MDRTAIAVLIEEAYAARRVPDTARIMACFHEEAEFQVAIDESFGPLAQPICGQTSLRPAMEEMCTTWDWSEFHIAGTVIDLDCDPDGTDAKAAVHSAGTMIHRPSGQHFGFEAVDLLTIRDGRIVRFHEFFDGSRLAPFLAPFASA